MSRPALFLLVFGALGGPLEAGYWGFDEGREPLLGRVWESRLAGFGPADYGPSVERLMADFERASGRPLSPGARRRAAVKVYTNSGPGLATPRPLLQAVLTALERRGFGRDELFILDLRESNLRAGGFIPPLSRRGEGPYFEGVRVVDLDSGQHFDPTWFYEDPLPPPKRTGRLPDPGGAGGDRKSFLPANLLTGVDFWINLPAVSDHPAIGVNGALANATVWNVSNRDRFLASRVNGPVAVAEIAAVPELLSGWALTLVSLERYQFIGGPAYNARYTASEPVLWLAADPVLLDALLAQRISARRREAGFHPLPEVKALRFAESLGVGSPAAGAARWTRLP